MKSKNYQTYKERKNMDEILQSHELKSFTKGGGQDYKLDKSPQLTPEMSIDPSSRDEYENKIHNVGGQE